MPTPAAKASFFDMFGTEVSAQTESTPGNSQNMALLAASVSPVASKETKAEKAKSEKNGEIDPDKDVSIVAESALLASTSPLGNGKGGPAEEIEQDISVYVVRKGDTLSQVAAMFDVSTNTILWANDMKKGQALQEGDVLLILPISGLEHTVAKGETLKGIAGKYHADLDEVISYNGLKNSVDIQIGDKLIIPDGQKSEESSKPIKNLAQSIAKDNAYYQANPVKNNVIGYFINPVPGYRKSQGLHDKNGVDLAIGTGTPIYAAADGRVSLARNGYNGGFGNVAVIKHSNGTETLYAHMSRIATTTGSKVTQGQIIGYVGSTGRSTGPHLHFEVHGAKNPGTDASWKN